MALPNGFEGGFGNVVSDANLGVYRKMPLLANPLPATEQTPPQGRADGGFRGNLVAGNRDDVEAFNFGVAIAGDGSSDLQ